MITILQRMNTVVHPLRIGMNCSRLGWTTISILILLTILTGCNKEDGSVRLAFMGDVMVGRGTTLSNTSLKFLETEMRSADLALANLESPLTSESPASSTGYNLCASPENGERLAQSGLDMLSVVNNHSLDCGNQGYLDTLSALESYGLVAIDGSGTTTSKHGVQLTFLAYEDISQPLDLAAATHAIKAARSNGSIVVVSIHWGMEYQGGASQRQKQLAAELAAAGATIIWGHHPHVLQPAEWIPADCADSEDKIGCSLVLYSLGNALFDQPGLADTRRSALVSIELDQNGIVTTQTTPFVIDPVHSLIKAPGVDERELILTRLQRP